MPDKNFLIRALCCYQRRRRSDTLLECLSDYIPLYRRFSCDGRGLEVVLDWTCRIRIAFPVLRDFNQPVPLLGIYNSGEYTAQSCKKD